MVKVSSGASFILAALADFTPELASHLQGLMKKDIEHFADGMQESGVDPSIMRERGLHGAGALVDVVNRLHAARASAPGRDREVEAALT